MPLFTLLFLSMVNRGAIALRPTIAILGRATILLVTALIVFWSTRYSLDFTSKFLGQWYYTMVHFGGLSFLGAFLLNSLINFFSNRSSNSDTLREDILLWGFFFSMFQISEALSLTGANHWGFVLILPLLRAALLLAMVFLSQVQENGNVKVLLLGFLILAGLLLVYGVIGQLLFMHLQWLQLTLTILALGAGIFFFVRDYSG